MHRLQVGLFGLAAMLLIVGLANIIMDRARASPEAAAPSIAGVGHREPLAERAADPLADIGVVPARRTPTAARSSGRTALPDCVCASPVRRDACSRQVAQLWDVSGNVPGIAAWSFAQLARASRWRNSV